MTVVSSPMNARNTHHVKLSDGIADVGLILCDPNGVENERAFSSDPVQRSSIKFYQGEQALSDLEPPWQDVVMDDWSGGRGEPKYETDTSKYWDSRSVDTTNQGITLGPMILWDKGTAVKAHNTDWPDFTAVTLGAYTREAYSTQALYGATTFIARKFVASSAYTPVYLYFYAKKIGTPSGILKVYLAQDDGTGQAPHDNDWDYTAVAPNEELKMHMVSFGSASAFTSSASYWIIFGGGATDDANNHYEILTSDANGSPACSTRTGTWDASEAKDVYYRLEAAGTQFRAHMAETKGALYAGAEYVDGTTSKVFICGTSGVATGGAAGYLADTNNAAVITNDLWNAAILRLFSGTGAYIPSPWRVIWDTETTNSLIDVYPNFGVTPSTDTRYVVLGSDRWTEVTGHSFAAGTFISDVLATHGAIYWALGPSVDMKRLIHNYSGATYFQWAAETNNKYTFLKALTDAATTEIWGANRTLPATVAKASAIDLTGGSGSALTFGSAINVGDLGEKITGLQVYGEQMPLLYVFKEGSVYFLENDVPKDWRISGMKNAADERNGYASVVHDVYLYFSFLDSVERYYSTSLDDVGPNKKGGMQSDRRGLFTSFVSYPGLLYATIDGGYWNYSSIVGWNGQGWHELFRSPVTSNTCRLYGKLYIQPLPGDHVDRMYTTMNGNLVSFQVHTNPYTHNSMGSGERFQYYTYAPAGSIETGWIHLGLEGVNKLFNSVTIHGENLSSTYSKLYLDYKLDDDSDYTVVGQFTIANDTGELLFDDATHDITGKRIRLRIRMETLYTNSTPKIDAIILEALAVVPSKQILSLTFRLEDNGKDLIGQPDDYTDADTKLAQLRTWAADAGSLAMSGHIDELNGLRVKIDYPSLRITKHEPAETGHKKRNRYVAQFRAWVID